MINIHGVQPTPNATPVEPVGQTQAAAQAAQTQAPADVVEISVAAKLAAKLQAGAWQRSEAKAWFG